MDVGEEEDEPSAKKGTKHPPYPVKDFIAIMDDHPEKVLFRTLVELDRIVPRKDWNRSKKPKKRTARGKLQPSSAGTAASVRTSSPASSSRSSSSAPAFLSPPSAPSATSGISSTPPGLAAMSGARQHISIHPSAAPRHVSPAFSAANMLTAMPQYPAAASTLAPQQHLFHQQSWAGHHAAADHHQQQFVMSNRGMLPLPEFNSAFHTYGQQQHHQPQSSMHQLQPASSTAAGIQQQQHYHQQHQQQTQVNQTLLVATTASPGQQLIDQYLASSVPTTTTSNRLLVDLAADPNNATKGASGGTEITSDEYFDGQSVTRADFEAPPVLQPTAVAAEAGEGLTQTADLLNAVGSNIQA